MLLGLHSHPKSDVRVSRKDLSSPETPMRLHAYEYDGNQPLSSAMFFPNILPLMLPRGGPHGYSRKQPHFAVQLRGSCCCGSEQTHPESGGKFQKGPAERCRICGWLEYVELLQWLITVESHEPWVCLSFVRPQNPHWSMEVWTQLNSVMRQKMSSRGKWARDQ